ELADVQKHHMAVTLAVALKVVTMLFTIAKHKPRSAKSLKICERVTVGNVIAVSLDALQVGDENEIQVVGSRQRAQIFVRLLSRETAQVEVRVATEPARPRSAEEQLERQIDLSLRLAGQVHRRVREFRVEAGESFDRESRLWHRNSGRFDEREP